MHAGGTQSFEPPTPRVSFEGRCPGAAVLPAWEVGPTGPPPEPPDDPLDPPELPDDPLEPELPDEPPGAWPDPPEPPDGWLDPPELLGGAEGFAGALGDGLL
jgi:hypothetical protein